MPAHFEPGPIILRRAGRSFARRVVPAGPYDVTHRTAAGNYSLSLCDGRFEAIMRPEDLDLATRTNARTEGERTA